MENILSSNNKKVSPSDIVESHYSLDIENDEGFTNLIFMLNFQANFCPTFLIYVIGFSSLDEEKEIEDEKGDDNTENYNANYASLGKKVSPSEIVEPQYSLDIQNDEGLTRF